MFVNAMISVSNIPYWRCSSAELYYLSSDAKHKEFAHIQHI